MKKKYDLLSAGWAIVILILCGIPGKKIPRMSFLDWLRPDKVVHLFLFGIFCLLLISSFSFRKNTLPEKSRKWLGLSISILYGILIEVLQTYVFIDRSGDYRDAIANSLGALLGLFVFNRFWQKRLKPI